MKSLQEYIKEGILDDKETAINNADKKIKYNYFPKNIKELETIVDKLINERGNNADLNDIYTGYITDMSCLFENTTFNGDISKWDVSKVIDMEAMFFGSNFNGDISKWNVSKVKNTKEMFKNSLFNGDISTWKLNKNCLKNDMFINCPIKEKYKPKFNK